jgi:signal transduction histidine kinase
VSVDPEVLARIPLFADLDRAHVDLLGSQMKITRLAAGEVLFNEGDPGDSAYVVLDGLLEVTNTGPWQPLVVGESQPGDLVGEMALLREGPRTATVTAREETTLGEVAKAELDLLLATGTTASAVYQKLLDRWEETRDRLRQGERVAQLGVLAAGVAHELNNPSAAIKRSAAGLEPAISRMVAAGLALATATSTAQTMGAVHEVVTGVTDGPRKTPMSSLARLDAETALASRLGAAGLGNGGAVAAEAVSLGLDEAALAPVLDPTPPDDLGLALEAVLAAVAARKIAQEIGMAAGQVSAIVATLSSYSRLDRAPTAEVDLHEGLEKTLSLLSHRLDGIDIVRDYADDLPLVTATETELNQVWTNLIANAADAVGPGGMITVRTRVTDDRVVVEIEDNGPGIPPADLERIFYAFYTTKAPGKGVGLGLAVTQRIVSVDHDGEIEATSEPGCTIFRVLLPR